jgi:hypothetical protein
MRGRGDRVHPGADGSGGSQPSGADPAERAERAQGGIQPGEFALKATGPPGSGTPYAATPGAERWLPSKIDDHVISRPRTACQQVAVCRRLERNGVVAHGTGNQAALAAMTHPGTA